MANVGSDSTEQVLTSIPSPHGCRRGIVPWNHHYKKGPYSTTWHRNEQLLIEEGHVTDLLTDEAVNWIDKTASGEKPKPFFLYVPFTTVHLPIREPDEWMGKVPAQIQGEVQRQFSACILHLDAAVGRIVEAIDRAGEKPKEKHTDRLHKRQRGFHSTKQRHQIPRKTSPLKARICFRHWCLRICGWHGR